MTKKILFVLEMISSVIYMLTCIIYKLVSPALFLGGIVGAIIGEWSWNDVVAIVIFTIICYVISKVSSHFSII